MKENYTIRKNPIAEILKTGLLVGILDGTAASVYNLIKGGSPIKVFQFIASGVFGKEAFQGGYTMALIGLGFHFIVALGWTTLFYLLYPKVKIFSRNKFITGMIYGIIVFFAMKFTVLPLSNVRMLNPKAIDMVQILIHMFVVGLPISILANKYYQKQNI
jgi:hypothetical protein